MKEAFLLQGNYSWKVFNQIQRLKAIEQRVIAHEMAHKVVGGKYTGAVHYTYTQGPDGRYYITGGEVAIDVSPESDLEETIRKMQIVRAAALAPADPSPQDIVVAQKATLLEMKARLELAKRSYQRHQNLFLTGSNVSPSYSQGA